MDDIRDQYDTGSQGVPSLEAFGVSPTHGFVLGNHLTHLPAYYEPWCTLCRDLSTFIEKRTLQHLIHQMPLLDHTHLKSHRELLIAHAMLSSLASGYVWLNGEKQAPKVLPKRLAVPLCAVSERVGLPPILCHPTLILANVCPKDPSQEMSLGNLATIQRKYYGITSHGGLIDALTNPSRFGWISVSILLARQLPMSEYDKAEEDVQYDKPEIFYTLDIAPLLTDDDIGNSLLNFILLVNKAIKYLKSIASKDGEKLLLTSLTYVHHITML